MLNVISQIESKDLLQHGPRAPDTFSQTWTKFRDGLPRRQRRTETLFALLFKGADHQHHGHIITGVSCLSALVAIDIREA